MRRGTALLALAWFVVPLVLSWVSHTTEPFAWQGRYALPLAVGLPLLAGLAVTSGRGVRHPRTQALTRVSPVMLALAHLVAVVSVVRRESGPGGPADLGGLVSTTGATLVVALLALTAVVVVLSPWRPSHRSAPRRKVAPV